MATIKIGNHISYSPYPYPQFSGLPQLGTLGAGNHYGEVQFVEEIFDEVAAKAMGITKVNQIVLMVHCGSRGFGHQVATDALAQMEKVQ